jgi:very-short-patch-repair endonuclease
MAPRLQTKQRARSLRRAMTPPEVRLWVRLRLLETPRFRRQHPVGPYILDFYCHAAGLAVEVDGQCHGVESQGEHDARRDAWLKGQGFTVMRLPASDVLRDPDDAARQAIETAIGLIR